MSTLLIIGGSGFFGKSILDMFQRGGLAHWNVDKVIAVSRNAKQMEIEVPELVKGNVDLIELDIASTSYLPEADYVIHAATSADARNYMTAGKNERENIQAGILNYCHLVRKINRNTKLLYISSGAIYGTQPPEISHIKETYLFKDASDIPEGKRDYTIAKREAEELIKKLGDDGFNVSVARCFSFVGKYLPRDQHFAIGNFIEDVINKRIIVVKAKHKVYRSYMYADDLVEWMMTILDHASPDCPIFNVGSDQPILLRYIADEISKRYHLQVKIAEELDNKLDHYIPSIEKAKAQLSLQLKFDTFTSIEETIKRISNHAK